MELVRHDRFRQVPATTREKTELCEAAVTCSQPIAKQNGGQTCWPPAHQFPTASPPRWHCRTWHFYNRHTSHEKKRKKSYSPSQSLRCFVSGCSRQMFPPGSAPHFPPGQPQAALPAPLPEVKLQRAGNRLDVPVAALEIYIPWTFWIWRNKTALK